MLISSVPELMKKSIALAAEPPPDATLPPVIVLTPPETPPPVTSTRRDPVTVRLVAIDVVKMVRVPVPVSTIFPVDPKASVRMLLLLEEKLPNVAT